MKQTESSRFTKALVWCLAACCFAGNASAQTTGQAAGKFITASDGARLYYRMQGTRGDTIVFLQAFGSADAQSQIRRLAQQHVLVTYDRRGTGKSSDADSTAITAAAHVGDLEDLRKALNIPRMTLYGQSIGAALAVMYADAHPQRVTRLILAAPPSIARDPFEAERAALVQRRVVRLCEWRGNERAEATRRQYITDCMRHPQIALRLEYDDTMHVARDPRIANTRGAAREAIAQRATVRSLGNWNHRALLAGLRMPALIVEGTGAPVGDNVDAWLVALRDARLLWVHKSAHYAQMENPHYLFPALEQFLDGEWPLDALPPVSIANTPELVVQDHMPGKHIAFSPDGKFFATTDDDGPTVLWETSTGRVLRVLRAGNQGVNDVGYEVRDFKEGGQGVAFSPDGRYVAATSIDLWRAPTVWEVASGRALTTRTWVPRDSVLRSRDVPWSAAEIHAWRYVRTDSAARRLAGLRAHDLVAISADGRIGVAHRMVQVANSPVPRWTIAIRELPSNREIGRLPQDFDGTVDPVISPDGHFLAVRTNKLEIWDLRTLRKATELELTNAIFNPAGTILVAGPRNLKWYRTSDWQLVRTDSVQQSYMYPVKFSSDGRLLALQGVDQERLMVVEAATGRTVLAIDRPRVAPLRRWAIADSMLALSAIPTIAENESLYPVSHSSIVLWPSTGTPRVFADSLLPIEALALSPGGQFLAAGTLAQTTVSRYTQIFTGNVQVWNTRTGAQILVRDTLQNSDDSPTPALAFTPDGRYLLAPDYTAIIESRNCSYAECGEAETTSYRVRLNRWDLRTGVMTRLMNLGMTSTEGRSCYRFSGDARHLFMDGGLFNTRTLRNLGRANVPSDISPSTPWCEESQSSPQLNQTGALAVSAGGYGLVLVTRTLARDTAFKRNLATHTVLTKFADSTGVMALVQREAAAGFALRRIDMRTGAELSRFVFPEAIDDYIQSGPMLFTRTRGAVRMYGDAGKHLATLMVGPNAEWLVVTPGGLYDSSPRGHELAYWNTGDRLIAVTELPGSVRTPNLLARLMRGEMLSPAK